MSAFMVSTDHIDALLTAGLARTRCGAELRWLWPEIGPEDQAAAYERGEPWGPESARLYNERTHQLTDETAGQVGAMLLAENRKSLDWRYSEDEIEQPYLYRALRGRPDPLIVLKAISCFEYQACEHPEWPKSEARAFCEALRDRMISLLPGYDDAPGWEVHTRSVFVDAEAKTDAAAAAAHRARSAR